MSFDDVRAVADAVLFEGYALYPYRASSQKNRLRWQFGVLAPRGWSEGGGGDAWWQETQCLVQPTGAAPRLEGRVRFLQVKRRQVEGDALAAPWDEGEIQQFDFAFDLAPAAAGVEQAAPFFVSGGIEAQPTYGPSATVIHQRWPISGVVRMTGEPLATSSPLWRVRFRVENVTAWTLPGAPRDDAMRGSLLGTHVLLSASGADFVSLLDPPPWAADAAAACHNVRTYPVLAGRAGRRDLLLSAPVILYDHPAVAPESPRDLFDATEIDEILTLRILTLTDDEKREVRATDPRLAALLDGVERLGPAERSRLHGVTRDPRDPTASAPDEPPIPLRIDVRGILVGPGSRVRLRPGPRRTDAQDMFLDGLTATVETIMRDVEDRDCLAVTIEGDPAAEILRWQRRFLYFYPDEVEPLEEGAPVSGRVLVAGIGNVFLGDDGFGVEVARRLAREPLPEGAKVEDIGIRALHLAFALLDRPDLLLLVDTVARGGPPGTLYLIEPEVDLDAKEIPDAHGMNLETVLAAVRSLGGELPRTLIVGCEPASLAEGMELSPVVASSIPLAIKMVGSVVEQELGKAAAGAAEETGR